MSPTFLERVMSYDGTGLPGGVERAKERRIRAEQQTFDIDPDISIRGAIKREGTPIPEHAVLREATTAERKLIGAIRRALKEYDRAVKPDRRVGNGRRPVDPKAVAKGLKLMASGMSIRRAAEVTGTSFGTLWKAQQAKQSTP